MRSQLSYFLSRLFAFAVRRSKKWAAGLAVLIEAPFMCQAAHFIEAKAVVRIEAGVAQDQGPVVGPCPPLLFSRPKPTNMGAPRAAALAQPIC